MTKNNSSALRAPHSALRMCVVCRERKTKDFFLRAVLTKDGKVSFDESGKGQGRGAYVCNNKDCIAKLLKQRGFNRSFKRDAGQQVYGEIESKIKNKNEE